MSDLVDYGKTKIAQHDTKSLKSPQNVEVGRNRKEEEEAASARATRLLPSLRLFPLTGSGRRTFLWAS